MTYELIGSPRIEPEYCDQWETTMVCDVRREDGVIGDVWIVAGVPDYQRGSSEAARTQRGYETVRVSGTSPDHWCPPTFQDADLEGVSQGVIEACMSVALAMHRTRMNDIEEGQ